MKTNHYEDRFTNKTTWIWFPTSYFIVFGSHYKEWQCETYNCIWRFVILERQLYATHEIVWPEFWIFDTAWEHRPDTLECMLLWSDGYGYKFSGLGFNNNDSAFCSSECRENSRGTFFTPLWNFSRFTLI